MNPQGPANGPWVDAHGVSGMAIVQRQGFLNQHSPTCSWERRHVTEPRDPRCRGALFLGTHRRLRRGSNQAAAYYSCCASTVGASTANADVGSCDQDALCQVMACVGQLNTRLIQQEAQIQAQVAQIQALVTHTEQAVLATAQNGGDSCGYTISADRRFSPSCGDAAHALQRSKRE